MKKKFQNFLEKHCVLILRTVIHNNALTCLLQLIKSYLLKDLIFHQQSKTKQKKTNAYLIETVSK